MAAKKAKGGPKAKKGRRDAHVAKGPSEAPPPPAATTTGAPGDGVPRPGHVLILRTCNADLTSYGGFQWPASGPVECPDLLVRVADDGDPCAACGLPQVEHAKVGQPGFVCRGWWPKERAYEAGKVNGALDVLAELEAAASGGLDRGAAETLGRWIGALRLAKGGAS